MDPITTAILAALLAGVLKGTTDVAQRGLMDAYNGLKSLIQRKLGADSRVANSVTNLEEDPKEGFRQQQLAAAVEKAGVANDPELKQAAEALQALVAAQPGGQTYLDRAIRIIGNFNVTVIGGGTATQNITGTPPAVPSAVPPDPKGN